MKPTRWRALGVALVISQLTGGMTFAAQEKAATPPPQQVQVAPQQPMKNPEESLRQMGPAMSSMMESMMSGMMRFYAQPDTADMMASFTRNYYAALVKKGFSEAEALEIVKAAGVPSLHK